MKAIVVHRKEGDGAPSLQWEEVADPEYGPEEVLVDVRAAAVNRADLSQARGNYPPPPGVTEILGLEMAGVIDAVGDDVQGWRRGDRVCALLPGGGYAEKAAVHADMLLRLPDDWTFEQGAAVPEVWYTAYVNLFLEGALQEGETVLLHAGGSGVGTAAIQLARESGARVFITAGAPEKLEKGQALGASLAVNYKEQDFTEPVREATGGEGVDMILDPVGANYFARNLRLLKANGRLVQIGLLSGAQAEINLGLVLGKSLRIIGSRLRPRPLSEKIAITRRFEEEVWPLLRSGTVEPIIDSVFPLEEAGKAHEYVREDRNTGKVILQR
ncbi:MAG: NAD(P)H-quinone oxidoreductase [Candidatus Promineifilaceae bacterium]|nr:NAD(P)H-quinone oxidoreductase [Candidatus Promineifilaceae bacterium]